MLGVLGVLASLQSRISGSIDVLNVQLPVTDESKFPSLLVERGQ